METYVSAIAGLVGALIGASASVLGQMLTEWRITRRNERDVLRAACGEFAAGAFASLQRIELATIESRHIEDLSALGHDVDEMIDKLKEQLLKESLAVGDAFSTAFCKVRLYRRYAKNVDSGEHLYRRIMNLEVATTNEPGKRLCDREREIQSIRPMVVKWVEEQAERIR